MSGDERMEVEVGKLGVGQANLTSVRQTEFSKSWGGSGGGGWL